MNFLHHILLLLLASALPGASAETQGPQPSLAWSFARGGWELHKILPPTPPSKGDTHIPLLRLEGILLHEVLSDGSTRRRQLPLVARRQDEKSLYFEAEVPREHHFFLRLDRFGTREGLEPLDGQGKTSGTPLGLGFHLRDEVGIRTRASRIALRFRWIRQGPTPRLVQGFPSAQGNLHPEGAFGAPFLLLGDQRDSLALTPRIPSLRVLRRLPLFLSFPQKGGTVLEFGFATTRLLSGRVVEAPGKAPPLREEDLELEGQLHFFPETAPNESLPPLLDFLWEEGAKKAGEEAEEFLGQSWREKRARETRRILKRLEKRTREWKEGADQVQDLAGPEGILMEAALVLGRIRGMGERPSALSPPQKQLGEECFRKALDLLSLAPRKSGLFRTHFLGHPKDPTSWLLREGEPFSTEDCARVALLLWNLRPLLDKKERLLVQALCEKLAHFLVENQSPRGTIPAFFREDLSPVRDDYFENSAGSLACGRFLLAFGTRARRPRAVQAAISLLKALEARHRNPPIPDPKLHMEPPPSFPSPLRAQTALDALALSLQLAKTPGGTPFLSNARNWFRELSMLQVTASAPTFQDRRRGAFLGSNLSPEISPDLESPLSILLEAAEALHAPQALSRARENLRFHFSLDRDLSPSLLRDMDQVETRRGSLVLDSRGRNWCATENFRVSFFSKGGARGVEIAGGPALRKEKKFAPWGSFLGEAAPPQDWTIQGGGLSPAQGARRILLHPKPLNLVRYEPPQEVDRRFDLPIDAEVLDVGVPPSRAWLSYGPPLGPMAALPMKVRMRGERAVLGTTIPKAFLPEGERLLTRIHLILHGREVQIPVTEMAETVLGDSFLFDFNDPGSLRRLGIRRTRRSLPQGMGMGVSLGKEALRLKLPIPPQALRVRLQLRVQGRVELRAGKKWKVNILPKEGDPFTDRSFILHDREDWSDGEGLRIQLLGQARESALLRLRYSHEGQGSPVTLFAGIVPSPRTPPGEAQVLVLPTSLGAAFTPTSQELALGFFGPSSGSSLRSWIQRISQDKLRLSGKVLPWRSLPPGPGTSPLRLAQACLRLHRETLSRLNPGGEGAGSPPDFIFIPFRRGKGDSHALPPSWLSPRQAKRIFPVQPGQEAPAILLFPLTGDSLSLGPPASLLLQVLSGLPPGPEGLASFGPRFPGRRPTPTGRPPEPSGLCLFEAGLGRLYRAKPLSLPEVHLPPLSQGGFLLELPIPFPGRGRLFVEARGPSLLLPPRLSQGELLVLRDTRLAPRSIVQGGHPSFLSPAGSLPSLPPDPTHPTKVHDLQLRTLFGERTWNLRSKAVEKDGTQVFSAQFLGKDLDPAQFRWSAREPGQPFFHGLPGAETRCPPKRGSLLRLECPKQLDRGEQRIFLEGRGTGHFTLRVFVEERLAFRTRLAPGPFELFLTLPAQTRPRMLRLELENLAEGRHVFVLEKAYSLHLVESLFQARNVAPRALERKTFKGPLSDGRYYSPALLFPRSRTGHASIPLPVSIPPEGGILRVRAATSLRTSPRPSPRIRVLFRPTGGEAGKVLGAWTSLGGRNEEIPLLRVDLGTLRGRTGFLILERQGSKAPIYLLECSIRRG